MPAVTSCPDRETLLAYETGTLPEASASSVIDHLSSCRICQAAVAELSGTADPLAAQLRAPVGEDPYSREPECQVAVARAKGLAAPVKPRERGSASDRGQKAEPASSGKLNVLYEWLGIPPDEQPPHNYRLLGIRSFEDDSVVIRAAAEQRLAHIRTFDQSKYRKVARKLVDAIGQARAVLLDPKRKAAYDEKLRKKLADKSVRESAAGSADNHGFGVGAQLGEYEILSKLGEGGMGAVYKALQTKLGRFVAVKVLSQQHLASEAAVARFDREMKAVGQLNHPHIVQAYDAREIDGLRLLVMEYVDGIDLASLVDRHGPLPVADACELVRQAAEGLQYVQDNGLVHRDIKPSNLMLTASGQPPTTSLARVPSPSAIANRQSAIVKILDLGLARLEMEPEPGEEITTTGQAMGTADYIAPEQVEDTHSVDIRADIYSLGCTLYKLLAGQPPFAGPDYPGPIQKFWAHANKPVPPIGQLREDIPPRLAIVLERMLAKASADRYATPAEVVEAIAPFAVESDVASLVIGATSKAQEDTAKAAPRTAAQVPPGVPAIDTRRARPAGKPSLFTRLRRLDRRALAVAVALIVLGAGLFGIVIRISKNGRETVVEVPEGSEVRVRRNGEVNVALPRAAEPLHGTASTPETTPSWDGRLHDAQTGQRRPARILVDTVSKPNRLKLLGADLFADLDVTWVHWDKPLSGEALKDADLLIVSTREKGKSYTETECQAVTRFVEGGGGLLIGGVTWSGMSYGGYSEDDYPPNQLAASFGMIMKGRVYAHSPARFADNPITRGMRDMEQVEEIKMATNSPIELSRPAEPLIWDRDDMVIYAISRRGQGRVCFMPAGHLAHPALLEKSRAYDILHRRILHWLSGADLESLTSPTADTLHASHERRAAEWVLRIGGTVTISDGKGPLVTLRTVDDLPNEEFWVKKIELKGNQSVSDDGLLNFDGLKAVEVLNLSNTPITERGLEQVSKLTTLRELLIIGTKNADGGWHHLSNLANLEGLFCADVPFDDSDLSHLRNMKNLGKAHLYGTTITDEGFGQFVREHPKLYDLAVGGTRLTGQSFEAFGQLSGLLWLDLAGSGVTDEGLKQLQALPRLETLILSQTRVTGAGLKYLSCFAESLHNLQANGLAIDDSHLPTLQALKNLQSLSLLNTKTTAEGRARLRSALPQCRIEPDDGTVEPTEAVPDSTEMEGNIVMDRGAFEATVGSFHVIDFEDFPLNEAGHGAFSNGHRFGPVSLKSLALADDIQLNCGPKTPSGLRGTFLVTRTEKAGKVTTYVRPGGEGTRAPESDDDFEISFAAPVRAAGLVIYNNKIEKGERIEFRAEDGSLIASTEMPGGQGRKGTGADGFVGLVVSPGGPRIKTVAVNEGAGTEDVSYDDVIYTSSDSP